MPEPALDLDIGSLDLGPWIVDEIREVGPVLIAFCGDRFLKVPNVFSGTPCFGEKSLGSISTETSVSSRRTTIEATSSASIASMENA